MPGLLGMTFVAQESAMRFHPPHAIIGLLKTTLLP